jgi:CHAT domain-containing protein
MRLFDKAEEWLLLSKELTKAAFGEKSTNYTSVLYNLAVVYSVTGDLNKANYLFNEVREFFSKFNSSNDRLFSGIYSLVQININAENYTLADSILTKLKEEIRIKYGEQTEQYATCLYNLAYLQNKSKKVDEVKKNYEQALEIQKNIFGNKLPIYLKTLGELVLFDVTHQKKIDPYKYLVPYLEEKSNALTTVLNIFSEAEKKQYLNSDFYLSDIVSSYLMQNSLSDNELLIKAYNLQLLIKSLSLSEFKNTFNQIRHNKDTSINPLYDKWRASRFLLSKQYSLPKLKQDKNLKDLEKNTEETEAELFKKSAEFRNYQTRVNIRVEDIQKKLFSSEAAIEFIQYRIINNNEKFDEIGYAAYVLKKSEKAPMFIPLFKEKELQQIIDSADSNSLTTANVLYRSITPDTESGINEHLGKRLYQLIWEPLSPYLKDITQISYSPSGILNKLAHHALPVDSSNKLLDHYQLKQYTSTREIAFRNDKDLIRPVNITLFGDPNFSMDSLQVVKAKNKKTVMGVQLQNRGSREWNKLNGTLAEVEKISLLFKRNKKLTKVFTQNLATEENVKQVDGNSPSILHIATHGFFLQQPEKSKSITPYIPITLTLLQIIHYYAAA